MIIFAYIELVKLFFYSSRVASLTTLYRAFMICIHVYRAYLVFILALAVAPLLQKIFLYQKKNVRLARVSTYQQESRIGSNYSEHLANSPIVPIEVNISFMFIIKFIKMISNHLYMHTRECFDAREQCQLTKCTDIIEGLYNVGFKRIYS